MNIFHQLFQCLQHCHFKTENKHDICPEKFDEKYAKNIVKLEIIVIIQVNIEVLHIACII